MACEKCQNVGVNGPTQSQQYVDPFSAEPAPRLFHCPDCGQTWWCTAEPHVGFWTRIDDRATILAVINGEPVRVGNPTTKV